MSAGSAIAVEGLWKLFRYRNLRPRTFKEAIVRVGRRGEQRAFWALRDVGLAIPKGSCWGVIGGNGSGKTTLFRILSGVIPPDRGRVAVAGAVSPVVDLMAGFNEDLTGYENARIGLHLHAFSSRETSARAARALEYADLGEFAYMPVRHYSSGMLLRLGFALSVCIDADVFLFDEVLAVGDYAFQRKCYDTIADYRRRGKTIVVISHDLPQVQRMCDRVAWLEGGAIVRTGEPADVIGEYKSRSAAVAPGTAGLGAIRPAGEAKP